MTDSEAECFDALIAYSQAKTATQRQVFGHALLSLHRKSIVHKPVDAEIASRNVFGLGILTLLTFADVDKNAQTLGGLLGVETKVIQTILDEFEKEGIITKGTRGEYHFDAKILKVSDHISLRAFYEYWIDLSKQALDLPQDVRKYRALKFALTPEEYTQALEKLDEYAIGLLSKFNTQSLRGRRLYMFESCLFPISKRFEEALTPSAFTEQSKEI